MADVLSALSDKYVEEISQKTPLYRLLVVLIFILLSYAARSGEYQSVWNSLLHISAARILDTDEGLLASLFLYDFAGAVLGLTAVAAIHRLAMRATFSQLTILLNLSSLAEKYSLKSSIDAKQLPSVAILLAREEERSIEQVRNQIRNISASAESAIALGVASLIFSYWGNALDIAISVMLLSVSVVLSYYSIRVFISKLLPRESHLHGLYGGIYRPEVASVLPTRPTDQ